MPSDKNREECHKKYDRPRLMVQLDTLTEPHEHPGPFGGVATLGAEACLAVLSCVFFGSSDLRICPNLSIGYRWGSFFPSFI